MLKPFNDHLLLELPQQQYVTANTDSDGQDDPNAAYGTVITVPELIDVHYLSSYTWIADKSIGNAAFNAEVHKAMKNLVGKKVYFEKRTDIGNTIEHEGKKYATIKLSKIIAIGE